MDYCLLEDAFKENTGCKDNFSIEKAKKHEKKKTKRTKDCFKEFENPNIDPDRPAYEKSNSSISLKELSEAFVDISANKIPIIPSVKALPSYFLGGDDEIEGFTSVFSEVEEKGFDKAGATLPIPSVQDLWKPITPSNNTSSYYNTLPTPGGTYPIWNNVKSEPREFSVKPHDDLQVKIDLLMKRLEALEKDKHSSQDNQHEIIAFVSTGIFVIFALNLLKH